MLGSGVGGGGRGRMQVGEKMSDPLHLIGEQPCRDRSAGGAGGGGAEATCEAVCCRACVVGAGLWAEVVESGRRSRYQLR